MFSKSRKVISMLIVFVIVFSYMGQTLEAIETTDGLSAITNAFFKTEEMKLESYFMQDGAKNTEKISNVNDKATLVLEIAPNDIRQGFLKTGTILASTLDGSDINFKFSKINNITIDELEDIAKCEEANIISENESNEENEIAEENNVTEEESSEIENVIENNRISNEVTSRSNEIRTTEENNNQEQLIDEEQTLRSIEKSQETYEGLTAKDFEVEIVEDNQIKIQNVIYYTTIEVEIEYNQKESLNIADLYKQINLKLNGTYININLEKIETETENNIAVGWSDEQNFEISGEYTQFSPFKLGEHTGSIVGSKINVKRETEHENYLPIKQTSLEIEVPDYNGNAPETVNVQSTKLMATRGEDLGNVSFDENNWKYDAQNKKIIIIVSNENDGKAIISKGEDEYIIVYRYKNYTEDETITMPNNFKVTVEGYSANQNNIQTKEFSNSQEIKTQINDLITYNIGSTQENLNKAKINANYLSEQAQYETEFTTTVNVNILTSDLLEEFKINSSKEIYLDNNSVEFDATQDVYYNKVKFNYNEIKSILSNGTTIEIQTLTGELLDILNNQTVINQDSCEVRLESKQKGIFVVFRNIANNGNISIEFAKAISKSNYDKSAFSNFQAIKSYVSAELKYQNYEERFGMSEISTSKKMQNSQTSAELKLMNNNLNSTVKNDGVEVRIVLNNHKQNTDLYQNPSFELVFPKYITDVAVENINLIYGCGLEIANTETYKEDNLVKMRVDLTGTQNMFSDKTITNGTNIILNLNLTLNEYTPNKQDQIKMYYYNELVTNYEAQTKWTIRKSIPNGILRQNNGFDVALINYQGGDGLVVVNSIINYDGQASKIKSINQGEKMAEIKVYSDEQIAKMELVAMNNTKNVCSDVIFLGRIPFEGNTSVVTKKGLGTNITTKMLSSIQENVQNPNMTTIYYSSNEKATKDLSNSSNGWTTNVTDFSKIKSYMIVVKGNLQPGNILKFTYDFEIPEGLGYDGELYGSFGAFYNNNQEKVISYESVEADKVGLATQIKPTSSNIINQPGLNMVVYPFGENDHIYYGQIVTLTAKVVNNTNQDISDSVLKVSIPTGTVYTERDYSQKSKTGKEMYQDDIEITEKEFVISSLKIGEVKEIKFDVRVLESDKDKTLLEGYVQLNSITQKYQWLARKGKMEVYASLEDNTITKYHENDEIVYLVNINRKTNEILGDLRLSFKLPDYIQVSDIKLIEEDTERSVVYNIQDRITIAEIGQLNLRNKYIKIYCKVNGLNVENATYETAFNVYEAEQKVRIYSSNREKIMAEKMFIEVNQFMNSNEFSYHDLFEYRLVVENKTEMESDINISNYIPDIIYFGDSKIFIDGEEQEEVKLYNGFSRYEKLLPKGKIEIVVTGAIVDWQGYNEQKDVSNIAKVILFKTGEEISSNEMNIRILGDTNVRIDSNDEILKEETQNEESNYSISGNVYVDKDGDRQKTVEDGNIKSQVQVQLLKDSTMLKATTTDSEGNYRFDNLELGDYTVIYHYDKNIYTSGNMEDSTILETKEGTSVTDKITIHNQSIENVNMRLQEKDKFDFEIKQYIMSASVDIKSQEMKYSYDKLELAKIEIAPSDLKDAIVKLKYKIVVTNIGNQEGQVSSIVDYLPNGVSFNQSENQDWTIGTIEGNIYYDGLKGIPILPGESQEILLTLNKKITEDNTGVISNKVQIAYTESSTRLTEAIEGNFASQETIVTLTQGSHTGLTITITTISITGVIGLFGYMIQTGKLDKKFNGRKWIKKVYK